MVFGRIRNAAYRITRRGANSRVKLAGQTNGSGRNVYEMSNGTYKTANGTPVSKLGNRQFTTTRRLNRNTAARNAQRRRVNNYTRGMNMGNVGQQLANANAEYKRMLNEKRRARGFA